MIQKNILYFGQACTLACDANCQKAWGINHRPEVYVEDPDQKVYGEGFTKHRYPQEDVTWDMDNTFYLADDELGIAPIDTGIYEGGHAKPQTEDERLNKWCARECERSVIVDEGEDIELPDYSVRRYNKAPHERPDTTPAPAESEKS